MLPPTAETSIMHANDLDIAARVAARHQAAVILRDAPPRRTMIQYSSGGRISAVALMKVLEPELGVLMTVRFCPALTGLPNTVSWEALDEHAHIVTGQLVLHAAVADDEVVSWAEVMIDGRTSRVQRVGREVQRRGKGLVTVREDDDPEGGDESRLTQP
jgi:hypothetical protein